MQLLTAYYGMQFPPVYFIRGHTFICLLSSRHILRFCISLMNLLHLFLADILQLYTVILWSLERLTSMLVATDIYCSSSMCQTLFYIWGTEINSVFTSKICLKLAEVTMGGGGGGGEVREQFLKKKIIWRSSKWSERGNTKCFIHPAWAREFA